MYHKRLRRHFQKHTQKYALLLLGCKAVVIGLIVSNTYNFFNAPSTQADGAIRTITANVGWWLWSITPSGLVPVTDGSSQTFTATPNNGYKFKEFGLNEGWKWTKTTENPYTFLNVRWNQTISAYFSEITPAIESIVTTTCPDTKNFTITFDSPVFQLDSLKSISIDGRSEPMSFVVDKTNVARMTTNEALAEWEHSLTFMVGLTINKAMVDPEEKYNFTVDCIPDVNGWDQKDYCCSASEFPSRLADANPDCIDFSVSDHDNRCGPLPLGYGEDIRKVLEKAEQKLEELNDNFISKFDTTHQAANIPNTVTTDINDIPETKTSKIQTLLRDIATKLSELNKQFAGVKPAINVGLSVSRVGGAAQTK